MCESSWDCNSKLANNRSSILLTSKQAQDLLNH